MAPVSGRNALIQRARLPRAVEILDGDIDRQHGFMHVRSGLAGTRAGHRACTANPQQRFSSCHGDPHVGKGWTTCATSEILHGGTNHDLVDVDRRRLLDRIRDSLRDGIGRNRHLVEIDDEVAALVVPRAELQLRVDRSR